MDKGKNLLNKGLIICIVAYSLMIFTFLRKIYMIDLLWVTKAEIYVGCIAGMFLLYYFFISKKKIIYQKFFLSILLGFLIIYTIPELKIIYETIDYKTFFSDYIDRLSFQADTSYLAEKIFKNKVLSFVSKNYQKYIPNRLELKKNREEELFDKFNTGLSSQEEEHIWTDGKVVRIPLYIDKSIRKGNIILTISAFEEQTIEAYVDDRYVGTFNDEYYKVILPFEKGNSNVVMLKFLIPTATKTPKSLGLSEDNRKLGVLLNMIEIEEAI